MRLRLDHSETRPRRDRRGDCLSVSISLKDDVDEADLPTRVRIRRSAFDGAVCGIDWALAPQHLGRR
jgi:hypothetical protein